jgi:hypothetical protein
MPHFLYARHFAVLAASTVLLFLLSRWNLYTESLIATFALSGALHAIALGVALREPQRAPRKLAFVALAAALCALSLYVGIIGLVLFAILPGNERLYVVLGVCSLSGAITYGSLLRIFWLRQLTPRRILQISLVCMLATSLAFLARSYAAVLGGWWLTAVWWFAFSGALWFFDGRQQGVRQ